MTLSLRLMLFHLFILTLAGCASLPNDFEEPTLTVSSIALRNSGGIAPQFDIMLHITNPNRTPLSLVGMSYSLQLAGNKVVTGVANKLPVIEAYGEADVPIRAAVSVMGGIRLLSELMTRNPDQIAYLFEAKLDTGKLRPRININRTGTISFGAGR
jgi:LEA14-like dessication related protein